MPFSTDEPQPQNTVTTDDPTTDDPTSAAPAAPAAGDQATDANHFDRIARRAFELYEARGSEPGRDQDDWFAAEREFTRD